MREALAAELRPHVLVVDEVGYLTYGDDADDVLYHVVNDRHIKRRPMIFTTNEQPKHWGQALHDDDLADAIVAESSSAVTSYASMAPPCAPNTCPATARETTQTAAEFPEPTAGHQAE